ncbi:MAG TPA: hypothetical protein VNQ72_07775 [Candidatus Dormibacteraeota bacterium]|nr:hypothetical protein [Candidatus Dormibacteraeota bacterium]
MLEQRGIPTVVMGTYEFEQLAKLESKNRGLADLPLALIPHPLGGIREDEVVKKAELVVDVVRKAVTRG